MTSINYEIAQYAIFSTLFSFTLKDTIFQTSSERLKLNRTEQKPKKKHCRCKRKCFPSNYRRCWPGSRADEPVARGIPCCPNFILFLLSNQRLPISYHAEYVYTHISDCVETEYQLPLLPNNTASEKLLHKSRETRNADWIFIIGSPAWRWLSEYVTLDQTFYSLLFK